MNGLVLLVTLFWGIQMGAKGFAIDTTNQIYRYVTNALIPLAIIKIIFGRYDYKFISISTVLLILSFGIMYTTGDTKEMVIVLSIMTFKDVKFDQIMQATFYIRGIFYFLRIILCIIGILDLQKNAIGECAFGFGHSNLAHAEFFMIFTSFILWKLEHIQIKQLAVFNVLNIMLFGYTKSKTPFILITVFSVLILMRKFYGFQKFLKHIVPISYIFLTTTSLILSTMYYRLPFEIHHTFFSRFQTANYMFRLYKFNIFGNVVNFLNDLGYVDMLFAAGIPWFLLFVFGHTALAKYFAKRSNWIMLCYLLIVSIYFVMEAYAESVLYNYCWLYYALLLTHKNSSLEKPKLKLIKESL